MKCRDCMHLSVCEYDAQKYNFRLPDNSEKCSFFADKSQYIKLPCKVGDAVYAIDSYYGLIKCIVNDIRVGMDNLYYTLFYYEQSVDCPDELIDTFDYDNDDLGKTVFLTKSEAKEAMKEGKENND